jgi:hypothetical protein
MSLLTVAARVAAVADVAVADVADTQKVVTFQPDPAQPHDWAPAVGDPALAFAINVRADVAVAFQPGDLVTITVAAA